MRKTAVCAGVLSWLAAAGIVFFGLRFFAQTQAYYVQAEPYYRAPVQDVAGVLYLRQDAFGKGWFGASRDGGRTHKGIDLLVPVGHPILASKSGRVSVSEVGKGYGQYVEIRHPDGLVTRYAHLSRAYAVRGEYVSAGTVIGLCGKTGNASNPRMKPHLHFEIRNTSDALNPSSGLLDPRLKLLKS